jgi:predicted adenylyl cyclase CyaB
MPVNLELKIKLNTKSRVSSILNKIGAVRKGILNQKDIYFTINNGLLKLRIQDDKNELIKYFRDETGKTRWSNYDILIISGNNLEEYFHSLFKIEVVVKKKRELWIYKNTRIHLDKVNKLGAFLELETLARQGKKKAAREFNEIISLLNLPKEKQILVSYRDLMLQLK